MTIVGFFGFSRGAKPHTRAFCRCARGLQKAGLANKLPDCKIPNMRGVAKEAIGKDLKELFGNHCKKPKSKCKSKIQVKI